MHKTKQKQQHKIAQHNPTSTSLLVNRTPKPTSAITMHLHKYKKMLQQQVSLSPKLLLRETTKVINGQLIVHVKN